MKLIKSVLIISSLIFIGCDKNDPVDDGKDYRDGFVGEFEFNSEIRAGESSGTFIDTLIIYQKGMIQKDSDSNLRIDILPEPFTDLYICIDSILIPFPQTIYPLVRENGVLIYNDRLSCNNHCNFSGSIIFHDMVQIEISSWINGSGWNYKGTGTRKISSLKY